MSKYNVAGTIILSWLAVDYALSLGGALYNLFTTGFSWFLAGYITSSLIILCVCAVGLVYTIKGIKYDKI